MKQLVFGVVIGALAVAAGESLLKSKAPVVDPTAAVAKTPVVVSASATPCKPDVAQLAPPAIAAVQPTPVATAPVTSGAPSTAAEPEDYYEEGLLNWAITHTLNQNQYKARLTTAIANGGPAAMKFERLKDLINYNYSYNVFRAIRQAKAALSSVEETLLDVPELNLLVPFTRKAFDTMLAEMMANIAELIDSVVSKAGLRYQDIDLVIRTGGSSQIVAVKNLLEASFPGKVTMHDPFTSVAGGLEVANYFGYEWK